MTIRASAQGMIQARADVMLMVALTSRPDLILQRLPEGFGFDYIAGVKRDGSSFSRLFAVTIQTAGPADAHGSLIILPTNLAPSLKEVPIPTCLCYFAMHDDLGRYAWLVWPDSAPDGGQALESGTGGASSGETATLPLEDFTPLDAEGLERLVGQVNTWYDAR